MVGSLCRLFASVFLRRFCWLFCELQARPPSFPTTTTSAWADPSSHKCMTLLFLLKDFLNVTVNHGYVLQQEIV
jgi:hypothetical protein